MDVVRQKRKQNEERLKREYEANLKQLESSSAEKEKEVERKL